MRNGALYTVNHLFLLVQRQITGVIPATNTHFTIMVTESSPRGTRSVGRSFDIAGNAVVGS